MLTCVKNMLDKMEYIESDTDLDTACIRIDNLKLFFKNGEYSSWDFTIQD